MASYGSRSGRHSALPAAETDHPPSPSTPWPRGHRHCHLVALRGCLCQLRRWPTQRLPHQRAASLHFSCWDNETQDHQLCRHQSASTRTNSGDRRRGRDGATRHADDSARALTSVTSTVEKSAMTQPPQPPPTQVFAQQRRSGCGTLLVALLVLAIITAIVIVLGAFGLLGWIFS